MISQTKPSFEELIVAGGDDRLDLFENGLNKYNVNPVEFRRVFSRASCTCSPLSESSYAAAKNLYEKLNDDVFDETRQLHIEKLKALINYQDQDRFELFFAPSGSDLCYYPLLFSKLLHPDRDIFSVVTCPEELGSGSIAAHSGRYFGKKNQFGQPIEKGALIDESLSIKTAEFPARSLDGAIINHSDSIIQAIDQHYHSHSVTSNLVIGSKSGIENNISIVSQAPEDVLWTIDLCQFRASRVLVNGLVGMNCCAMLTGSKFYQSPPFCAVLLVPKTISERFDKSAGQAAKMFRHLFSAHDIPDSCSYLRTELPDFRNYGLLLRWEAALVEMTSLAELETYRVNQAIHNWNQFVVTRLTDHDLFELMPGQDITNKTIVSFRAKNPSGEFLTHRDLQELYQQVCCKKVDGWIEDSDRILFGQPVSYGDKSFIRIALGSCELRGFVQDGENFANDGKLIDLIAQAIRDQS